VCQFTRAIPGWYLFFVSHKHLDPRRFTARVIKLTRVARGQRQADLAAEIGVSRERISQIETGRAHAGSAILARLATALDSADLAEIAASRRVK